MEHQRINRKRNILHLIHLYLMDNGLEQSAQSLKSEAKLQSNWVICDNINLEIIITEYELFYYNRFQKYPKICKSLNSTEENSSIRRKNSIKKNMANINAAGNEDLQIFGGSLLKIEKSESRIISSAYLDNDTRDNEYFNVIMQSMNDKNSAINLKDVKGLENEIEILKEAIIYPLKYPDLFKDPIESWKSILMYGPPGTGKTLLARTIANESSATFFNISASLLVSKWRGDTEKLIKTLFEYANQRGPSLIFIDEFDSIAMKRSSVDQEASRRMKSELFIRIDELIREKNSTFLLAATNTPWDLDASMLRRFEKQIYVGPPDERTRKLLLENFLPKTISKNPRIERHIDFQRLAQLTVNYSGSDIKNACKNIKMNYVRKIIQNLEMNYSATISQSVTIITTEDIEAELIQFKPTLSDSEMKFKEWKTKYIGNKTPEHKNLI